MNLVMADDTRHKLGLYFSRQAELNGVPVSALAGRYSVQPAVQQRFENAVKESADLLQKINIIGVTEQKGEKVFINTTGPIARTNTSSDGTKRRNPLNVADLKARQYQCEQVNYDTFISYPQLDQWAGHPDFQARISAQIARQVALDRIMIGFNGTSHADESNFTSNQKLQDVNLGWLKQIEDQASQRVLRDKKLAAFNEDGSVKYKGDYRNVDALVQDAHLSLLDEWHKEAPDLVVMMGRNLYNSLRLPILNSISGSRQNAELLAGRLILASGDIGGLPTCLVPFFPDGTLLITSFSNLSIYWQKGTMRRLIRDEPEYNRIATYQSINDAYVVEDYGKCAMVKNLTVADS